MHIQFGDVFLVLFFTSVTILKPLDLFASGESGLAGWLTNKRRFPESPELEGRC